MGMKSDSKSRPQKGHHPSFVRIVHALDGSKHSIGITDSGIAYSWGTTNALGQLGRKTTSGNTADVRTPKPIEMDQRDILSTHDNRSKNIPRALRAYVGGSSETGHSAIIDSNGDLWMAGCDRWQQLGLGSPAGGATGYTWGDGGKIWRDVFVKNAHLTTLIWNNSSHIDNSELIHKSVGSPLDRSSSLIRDVALGEDHTVVLSSNRRDVYTFGKGSEGQLGHVSKPFVSAPAKSTVLSSRSGDLAAVCAIKHCSVSLDRKGAVAGKAGRCNKTEEINGIKACIARAKLDGLLDRNE